MRGRAGPGNGIPIEICPILGESSPEGVDTDKKIFRRSYRKYHK